MFNRSQILRTSILLFLLVLLLSFQTASLTQAQTTGVFINELHYDNDSTDVDELVEVAGPAGTDLSGWSIVLYNGNGGASYDTINLSGTIPDQCGGFGALSFARSGIQNGSPDGLVLVNSGAAVVQFLSYEGSFAATNGPANGMTSFDIGVSEPSNTPVGSSLQLTGAGLDYEDFTWTGPAAASPGNCNTGQTFQGGPSNPTLTLTAATNTVTEGGDLVYEAQLSQAVDFEVIVDYTVTGAGTDPAEAEDFQGGSFPGGSITIPANNSSGSIVLTTVDDSQTESEETIEIAISLNGATGGAVDLGNSTETGLIADNDAVPSQPLPLTENFDNCALTGWVIVSQDSDQAHTWSCSTQYGNIEANGYGDSAPADEWLITPPLNMDAQSDEVLSFRNYADFADAGVPYPQLKVLYSTDYSGNPTVATWTELSGFTYSPADSGQWADSGKVDLSGVAGSQVYFAFHYTSSGTGSGSASLWRLDSVSFVVDETTGVTPAKVHDVQGAGSEVTTPGATVVITGVVTVDYQGSNELSGFFMQEETADEDGNPATSEGIFVFCGNCSADVAEGNIVQVTGTEEEFFNMSQIDVTEAGGNITVVDAGNNLGLITPVQIDLPAPAATNAIDTFEPYEGMLASFVDQLTVTEYFQLGRFGQIMLSEGGKQRQFTLTNPPDVAGNAAYLNELARRRIILDDPTNNQNIDLVYHPQPGGFSKDNFIRGGYTINNLTGVLHWSWAGADGSEAWRIRPQKTIPVTFSPDNPRSTAPGNVGGSLKVVSLNTLNYFTTINTGASICGPAANQDCRGANSNDELARQTAKFVAALKEIDADIIGVIELENNTSASLQALVDALNAEAGVGPYAFVDTGTIGADAIKVGFLYKSTTVTPVGAFKILDSSVDPNFIDTKNRPVLIQTFAEIAANERFTVALNHLKSKGSDCNDLNDPDTGDGQGNCPLTRASATQALANYLATDPTGSGDPDFLIIGDMNSYAMEAPITALEAAGYTDLLKLFDGGNAYSYVFDGQWGYLDHALASASLTAQVSGVTEWRINSDEVDLLDYNDTVRDAAEAPYEAKPAANPLYNPDPYRASDHDPVIIGLSLNSPTSVPQCNGVDATIYVGEDGKIVGGPADGHTYKGVLQGDSTDDVIVGTDDNDIIIGFAGNDLICGLGDDDFLNGLSGNDTIYGGGSKDLLNGGPGNDTLYGEDGEDLLNGGPSSDTCDGGNNSDIGLSCETKVNIP